MDRDLNGMSRVSRIDIPGLIYHVTSRGARQLPIYHDDQDRQLFLQFLIQIRDQLPFRLHAYCLMTNHFHLLIQTIDHSLAQIMQKFKRHFSMWLNFKYSRSGHSFQGRFHSIPVETDAYFATVASYIHLNAVRAGMVRRPEDYPWSNYPRLIRGEKDPLVQPQFLLSYFGDDPIRQIENYKRFVEDKIDKREFITEAGLYRMRFWGQPPIVGLNAKKRK